ncbi:MAG: lysophospholipid acyltransferase family protein [Pirellulales bacterium]|nr:lysophospholipid acyltransferase family protein [Pirellulales bacterium]
MRRNSIADWLVYLVVRVLICVVQAMRIDTGKMLARWFAWLFGDVLRIRAKVVDDNLAHALVGLPAPQRRKLARQMWEHLFLLVLEVARAPRAIHETNWRDYITLHDADRLVRLLLADRPVLIVTGHFGNFEVAGYVLAILGFPTHTVARTLDNPYLDRFLNRFRGGTGQRMIPKKGGYDQIVEVLARGGTMTFLADQYAGPKGCWVEFFGRPASAHKAIALLALEHDAPVAVCSARRIGGPLRIELDTPAAIDPRHADDAVGTVRDLTQWYTARLEDFIRRTPGQYWWLHRRWKDTREARRRKRRAA